MQGSAYSFGYHANFCDGSNALQQHLFLPCGYSGVTPAPYPPIGADAAAAVVQPQAYARPGFNYASPFTATLPTPLLNAVQSSLVTASSNAASEAQPPLSSPGQPSTLWVPENTSSCSENGFNASGVVRPGAPQPYAGLSAAVIPQSQQQSQQQQQDSGGVQLGPSAPGLQAALAPGGYGAAVDMWKHLAMVAATAAGGVQSASPMQVQPSYGTDYQLPYIQQQQQHAATVALQMQAAYLQQHQQQQQPAYAAAVPAMASLGAAAAAASLGAAQVPSGHGLTLGSAGAPAHVLQLIQHQQQQQQQKLQQQPMQAVVTPDSLSDPALAAAAATALHLLQLPAGLRALAACGMMPHLLQPQQAQPPQPQALQLPICTPASAACYGPGILAALLPPLAPAPYAPCEPLAAAARDGMGQLPYQPPGAASVLLSAQLPPRPPAFPVQSAPSGAYPPEGGPEVGDPRLQHLQLLQQQQQQRQLQPQSSQPLPDQPQQPDINPSQTFQEQQTSRQPQRQHQSSQEPAQAEQPQGELRGPPPSSPSAPAAALGQESMGGSLSAPSPADEPYTDETSSPSPTREPSSAPSGQVMAASQPTSTALLILGLQQQQQQQLRPFPRGQESLSAELQARASPRKSLLPEVHQGLPPGPQLLHFAGMPLQLPLPRAVLQAAACQPVQPAPSCPPAAAKSHAAGIAATAACTSTSAPTGAVETRRRTLADRRERRKESNRESARRCRLRREKDTCELSRRVTTQEDVNGKMASQLQRLEQATNMLLEQNNVLDAWLNHIQGAGDGASAAARTILGYVHNLDEQMAAAAAAVQLQAVASQGGFLAADPMAMVQLQPQPEVSGGDLQQGLLQQHQGWSVEAAAMGSGGVVTAGGVAGRDLLSTEAGDAMEAPLTRRLAPPGSTGGRSTRGGTLGGGSKGSFQPPLPSGDGEPGIALHPSGGIEEDTEGGTDDDEDDDDERQSDDSDDGVMDLEAQM